MRRGTVGGGRAWASTLRTLLGDGATTRTSSGEAVTSDVACAPPEMSVYARAWCKCAGESGRDRAAERHGITAAATGWRTSRNRTRSRERSHSCRLSAVSNRARARLRLAAGDVSVCMIIRYEAAVPYLPCSRHCCRQCSGSQAMASGAMTKR